MLHADDAVAVATMMNYSDTPDAGRSAEHIAANVLRASGLKDVELAESTADAAAVFDTLKHGAAENDIAWARSRKFTYLMTGAVEEWHYKTGVDGEPVVAMTFELVDVATGRTVWSSTGTRSGWSRSGLTNVAQQLITQMLQAVHAGT